MSSPPSTLTQATLRDMALLEQLESSYRLLAVHPGEAAAAADGGSVPSAQETAHVDYTRIHCTVPNSNTFAATANAVASEPPARSVGPQDQESIMAGGDVAEDCNPERRESHSISSMQARDVVAVRALIVQLYTRRLHNVSSTDAQYWQSQIRHLPSAPRRLAAACLGGIAAGDAPSTGQLLRNEFFTETVRKAAEFLTTLQPPPMTGDRGWMSARCQGQGQLGENQGVASTSEQACNHVLLAELAESSGILRLHKTPEALRICLPTIIQLLEATALQPADEEAGGSSARQDRAEGQHEAGSVASAFVTVYQKLLQCLRQHEVQQECVPLWQRVIKGRPREGQKQGLEKRALALNVKLQAAPLQPDVLRRGGCWHVRAL